MGSVTLVQGTWLVSSSATVLLKTSLYFVLLFVGKSWQTSLCFLSEKCCIASYFTFYMTFAHIFLYCWTDYCLLLQRRWNNPWFIRSGLLAEIFFIRHFMHFKAWECWGANTIPAGVWLQTELIRLMYTMFQFGSLAVYPTAWSKHDIICTFSQTTSQIYITLNKCNISNST